MNTSIYYPHSRSISRASRKQFFTWALITALAAGIAFMAGLTAKAIDAEGMRSLYLQQIDDLEAKISYLESRPVRGDRV